MKIDTKTLTEHIHYAENLRAAVGELAITQAELAKAIGKDQKTVGRYINGETYPEGCIAEIAEYLLSRLVEDDFTHIPSEKFEEIFSEIYDFLQDNGVREAEFAGMIGISQKTLNNYHNRRIKKRKPLRLSTEMQHKIIDAFDKIEGRLFAQHPDDDDDAHAAVRMRYYNIVREAHHYKYGGTGRSVSEMWELLIKSYKSGVNFFVYSPEKLELVCFYLTYLIRELDGLYSTIQIKWLNAETRPKYYISSAVASIDYLSEFERDLKETTDEDRTYVYCCGLLVSDAGRFRKTCGALSLEEKSEINAVLRSVYNSKMRKIEKDGEYYDTIKLAPFRYNFNDEKETKDRISFEELDELCEIFEMQPPELQHVILRCFDIFFWGISFENLDEVIATHKRLAAAKRDVKLTFIDRFEAEIIGDFWETGRKLDDDYDEKYDNTNVGLWEECSKYLQLMSFTRTFKTDFYFFESSEEYTKEFKKLSRRLAKDISPVYILEAQLNYTPLDWYVNMLADIALLKGLDFEQMLREIENI